MKRQSQWYKTARMIGALIGLGLVVSACGASTPAKAVVKFPTHPITLISPFAAGGGVDLTARALAPILGKELGVSVVVTDITGAGGVTGTTQADTAAPNGYTLYMDSPTIVDAPWTVSGVTYGPKTWSYIGQVTYIPNYLEVAATSPYKTLAELVAYGKAHPGAIKVPFIAGYPSTEVMGDEFWKDAGVKVTTVSGFTGGPAELEAVLSGVTTVSYNNTGEVLSDAQGGKVRILATSAPSRSPVFPKVPTFKQQGYDVVEGVWQGLAGPPHMPSSVVAKLRTALQKASKTAALASAFKTIGITVDYLDASATEKVVDAQYNSDGAVFRSLGVAIKK